MMRSSVGTMTSGRLFLVLACLLASQAHAASYELPSATFVQWLSHQSPAAKVGIAATYEEVESTAACLQEVHYRNCRCFNEQVVDGYTYCTHDYIETQLACCNHHDEYSDSSYGYKSGSSKDLLQELHSVGVCSYSEEYFTKAIKYEGSDTTKIGVFSVNCELRNEADLCGEPLCEGMTLFAEGDILRYPKVAFMGGFSGVTADEDCVAINNPLRSSGRTGARGARKAVKAEIAKAPKLEEPKSQSAYTGSPGSSEDDPVFYVGQGDIYSGTFWVTNKLKKLPFRTGQWQLVFASSNKYDTQYHPPEKCYIAKDGAIALAFFPSDKNYQGEEVTEAA